MAHYPKGFGDPAKKLASDIAFAQLYGYSETEDNYQNYHMQRGHREEPLARMFYESRFFCDVANGGFYDNGPTGCSPDGLVYSDGMIEIKSAIRRVQYERIKNGTFDPQYRWQLIFNLREAGREWIDFVSYCDQFPGESKMFACRLYKEDFTKELAQVDERVVQFNELVKERRLEALSVMGNAPSNGEHTVVKSSRHVSSSMEKWKMEASEFTDPEALDQFRFQRKDVILTELTSSDEADEVFLYIENLYRNLKEKR
jgi:hypothetical protein